MLDVRGDVGQILFGDLTNNFVVEPSWADWSDQELRSQLKRARRRDRGSVVRSNLNVPVLILALPVIAIGWLVLVQPRSLVAPMLSVFRWFLQLGRELFATRAVPPSYWGDIAYIFCALAVLLGVGMWLRHIRKGENAVAADARSEIAAIKIELRRRAVR